MDGCGAVVGRLAIGGFDRCNGCVWLLWLTHSMSQFVVDYWLIDWLIDWCTVEMTECAIGWLVRFHVDFDRSGKLLDCINLSIYLSMIKWWEEGWRRSERWLVRLVQVLLERHHRVAHLSSPPIIQLSTPPNQPTNQPTNVGRLSSYSPTTSVTPNNSPNTSPSSSACLSPTSSLSPCWSSSLTCSVSVSANPSTNSSPSASQCRWPSPSISQSKSPSGTTWCSTSRCNWLICSPYASISHCNWPWQHTSASASTTPTCWWSIDAITASTLTKQSIHCSIHSQSLSSHTLATRNSQSMSTSYTRMQAWLIDCLLIDVNALLSGWLSDFDGLLVSNQEQLIVCLFVSLTHLHIIALWFAHQ
jgi:hypothetical protein